MEKRAEKKMVVLVPLPFQGHITPMMQLGQALNSKGFSITVAHGAFGQVSSSQQFPAFQFITIPKTIPMSQPAEFEPSEFMLKFNKTIETSFKDCIAQLLMQQGNNIKCIIYDELMYFSEAAAKEFKIPSLIFITGSATTNVCRCILSPLNTDKFLDPQVQDKVVENMHPLRYKDLPTWGMGPLEKVMNIFKEIVNKRTASGVIINTTSCLENSSLSWLQEEERVTVYPLGPLHIITPSTNSSLLEQDRSCIEWLNKQRPRSVIYISFGSLAEMETKEVLEMAWGLCSSNQPFLWVIQSSSLPEEVSKMVLERGYVVKWAPQIEVLGHPSVGGFWSHGGWNSTLESIVEGVPMICRPFQGEQKLNAIYIENVWRVGIRIEGEVERRVVERAVTRLISAEEGAGMRERALALKEKINASIRTGGSSNNAFDELVNYLETE